MIWHNTEKNDAVFYFFHMSIRSLQVMIVEEVMDCLLLEIELKE